jgi:ABC-type amino acid transport substrate-binding protein
MKKQSILALFLALGGMQQVIAAEQTVPAKNNFTVTADETLKAKLPADILQRGYIVAGTNPNTPPTTFYQEDNKTLAGREIDIMSAVAERLGVQVQWHDTGALTILSLASNPVAMMSRCPILTPRKNASSRSISSATTTLPVWGNLP